MGFLFCWRSACSWNLPLSFFAFNPHSTRSWNLPWSFLFLIAFTELTSFFFTSSVYRETVVVFLCVQHFYKQSLAPSSPSASSCKVLVPLSCSASVQHVHTDYPGTFLCMPPIFYKHTPLTPLVQPRYSISKLLQVLFIHELITHLPFDPSNPEVIINLVNPGMSRTAFTRDASLPLPVRILDGTMRRALGRTAEMGSRTLVLGASAGPDSHGEFMSDGKNQPDVATWLHEDVGRRARRKVFEQTMKILESRSPGIGSVVGI